MFLLQLFPFLLREKDVRRERSSGAFVHNVHGIEVCENVKVSVIVYVLSPCKLLHVVLGLGFMLVLLVIFNH